ncbi:MAG: helix-turn-helix transcriptional regulator [Burkholderiaceae bacterium]|nr:helix-turn-helix transcriptional regulator [Burkholderiaceae bacterium]
MNYVPLAAPQQLKQIIAAANVGVILIDLEHTISWANDLALSMHNVERLAHLGGTVAGYHKKYQLRYLNHHRLKPMQYPIDRLLAHEEFSNVVVDIRMPDNDEFRAAHRIHGIALKDANGDLESWALVMQDITEDILAQERFEKTFNVNPAPALICSLSDLRYLKVNGGFLSMTGYQAAQVLGRSVYELDVLENSCHREHAIHCLQTGIALRQMEAKIKLPDGSYKCVVVAGQPIDMNDEKCMLFTFIDLDKRKRIEDALRHSEERFSTAFRLAPVPMMVIAMGDQAVIETNDALSRTTGYSASELAGQDVATLPLWVDTQQYRSLKLVLQKNKRIVNHEIQLRNQAGVIFDCLASAEKVTINEQDCMLCVLEDITERKQSEVELIKAIDVVMQDASWFSRSVIEKLAQIRQPKDTQVTCKELADLTPREHEVLGWMCQGLEDEEIAQKLNITKNTIRNHIATIYNKINVRRRGAAIVWARQRGIVGYEKPQSRNFR